MFQFLKINGFKLALVTNSNEKTCKIILNKLKIKKFFDIIVTNNSNIKPKPNPAPYLFAMSSLKLKKRKLSYFRRLFLLDCYLHRDQVQSIIR